MKHNIKDQRLGIFVQVGVVVPVIIELPGKRVRIQDHDVPRQEGGPPQLRLVPVEDEVEVVHAHQPPEEGEEVDVPVREEPADQGAHRATAGAAEAAQ